ncbi:MAG: uracil-DNA glycosylase family protein [Pseudomonadota bacterium]
MKPLSQEWLAELNLSPLWRQRGTSDEVVAPASLPATPKNFVQGIHNRGYLPHLKAEGGIYFVTFRLADSLPQSALDELERSAPETRSKQIETYLDAGHGECCLRKPEIAQIVIQALKQFEGERYVLHDWVVMPNHVHLVIEPRGAHALSDILHSLKSFTATEANRCLGRHGAFWQHESYDRLIRGQEELDRCVEYVRQNSVRANLAEAPEQYAYGCSGYVAGRDAGATTGELVAPALTPDEIAQLDWPQLKQAVATCTACALHAQRTQAVFGVGDEQADWLFVGEAPGAEEDLQGEPFVGQAGKLLDNMLASIELKRGEKVYIANVVKCRPPDNRNPDAAEVLACAPYLDRQIALMQPKLIVALGKVAAVRLLGKDATIASLRGQVLDYHGTPLIITYHPAYLLRSLTDKARAWEDLCFARQTFRGLMKQAAATI